jgi:beta-1,4-mannosyl-glycoprotein beta-1,4-N-acetylglucosaminyltransferase
MSIYDVQTFFNEIDLCLLRFEILDPYVDFFIVNESNITFSGNPKSLYFLENMDKFNKFQHKIIHYVFDEDTSSMDQWSRESAQRDGSINVLGRYCKDDDIIFFGDVDEIPNFENIDLNIYQPDKLFVCHQDFYYYYFNTLFTDCTQPDNFWKGTRFCSYELLKQNSIDSLRNVNSYFNKNNPDKVVDIANAGWHFSFLGNADKVKYKIESYSHQEMNVPIVKENIQKNIDELKDPFFRRNVSIREVEMTPNTHPKYLLNNLDKYKEYIKW